MNINTSSDFMTKFKETPRMYQADEVDSEIAILTQSKEFWRKKAEESKRFIQDCFIKMFPELNELPEGHRLLELKKLLEEK